jgi:hypothetical protein
MFFCAAVSNQAQRVLTLARSLSGISLTDRGWESKDSVQHDLDSPVVDRVNFGQSS